MYNSQNILVSVCHLMETWCSSISLRVKWLLTIPYDPYKLAQQAMTSHKQIVVPQGEVNNAMAVRAQDQDGEQRDGRREYGCRKKYSELTFTNQSHIFYNSFFILIATSISKEWLWCCSFAQYPLSLLLHPNLYAYSQHLS